MLTQHGCHVGANAAAMWMPNRVAKSMQNMVPILAQYGGYTGAMYAKYSCDIGIAWLLYCPRYSMFFVMLKRDVLVVVVFCVRD